MIYCQDSIWTVDPQYAKTETASVHPTDKLTIQNLEDLPDSPRQDDLETVANTAKTGVQTIVTEKPKTKKDSKSIFDNVTIKKKPQNLDATSLMSKTIDEIRST